MQKVIFHTKKKGSATVEVILAISLFGLIITGVIGAFLYSVQSNFAASVVNQANYLVDEGFAAVKSIKDLSFAGLVDGNYGISSAGASWVFAGGSDVSGIFTRTVNIATVDSLTKQVTINVTWPSQFTGISNISQSMYLANWDRFVAVLGNWALPSVQSSVNMTGSVIILGLRYSGNYVYAITNAATNNFVVFNVTNLASPVQVASISLPTTLTSIAISGNFAYVTSSANAQELSVVDISNPLAPSATAFDLSGNDNANFVTLEGTRLYILRSVGSNPELIVYDITLTPTLSVLGTFNTTSLYNEISIQGNYGFASSGDNSTEINILDLSNLASITVAQTINLSGNNDALRSRTFGGNRLIITRSNGGTLLYNSTNPLAISLISTYAAGVRINDLALGNSNKYLFLATASGSAEFRVINITNQALPVLLGSINLSGLLNGIVYDSVDDRIYTGGAAGNPEFLIIQPN